MIDHRAVWQAHQQARFMRHDAHRWIRPDAARFLKPGTNPADVYLALKYSPTQRRIPAGRTGGGRWTDESEGGGGGSGFGGVSIGGASDGSEGGEDFAATEGTSLGFSEVESSGDLNDWHALLDGLADDGNKPRPIPNAAEDDATGNIQEIGGGGRGRGGPSNPFPGATAGQLVRLDQAIARTENAITQVRQYEPDWLPRGESVRAIPGSIEGAIGSAEARAVEAEIRFEQLRSGIGGNFAPPLSPSPRSGTLPRVFDGPAWIDAYRTINNAPDLFGNASWPYNCDTVAVANVDGKLYVGINSDAPTYTSSDRASADALRWEIINEFPGVMRSTNIGRMPNDAIYHAEATILMRIANVKSLVDQYIEVHVDRAMCWRCETVLPLIGLKIGNPTVTFVNTRDGSRFTMRNGSWLP